MTNVSPRCNETNTGLKSNVFIQCGRGKGEFRGTANCLPRLVQSMHNKEGGVSHKLIRLTYYSIIKEIKASSHFWSNYPPPTGSILTNYPAFISLLDDKITRVWLELRGSVCRVTSELKTIITRPL